MLGATPPSQTAFSSNVLAAANPAYGASTTDPASVLRNHGLLSTFQEDVLEQLSTYGEVRIGLLDRFNGDTHGENSINFIAEELPSYFFIQEGEVAEASEGDALVAPIIVEDYETGTSVESSLVAYNRAIGDAAEDKIVALSVSGGTSVVNFEGLTSNDPDSLTASDMKTLYDQAIANLGAHGNDGEKRNIAEINTTRQLLASIASDIPVITPIWNDGSVNVTGLSSPQIIVASLQNDDQDDRIRATQANYVDFLAEPSADNFTTSQAGPKLLGQLFSLIPQEKVEAALEEFHGQDNTPADEGAANSL